MRTANLGWLGLCAVALWGCGGGAAGGADTRAGDALGPDLDEISDGSQVSDTSPVEDAADADSSADLVDTSTPPPLVWGPCELGAPAEAAHLFDCATLVLPVDAARPDEPSEEVSLHLTRAKALEPENRKGVLFVNPGGPGAGAEGLLAAMVEDASYAHVARYFDLIGLDWRGTGRSLPALVCSDASDWERYRALHPETDAAEIAAFERQLFADCGADLGESYLRSLTVEVAARDMDRARAALGEAQLNFYGASYGTRLGAAYATLFPERVRAIVLDAAVPPEAELGRMITGQMEGFTAAFDRFVAFCEADPECPLNGAEGADVLAAVDDLEASLLAAPLPVDGGRNLTIRDFRAARQLLLPIGVAWAVMAEAFADALAGQGGRLLELADLAWGRTTDGGYEGTSEANLAIICADLLGAGGPTRSELEAALTAGDEAWPRFAGLGRDYLPCYDWDLGTPRFEVDASRAPKLLVVGGQHDPATPLAWSHEMRDALGNDSWLIESGHEGHVAWSRGATPIRNNIRDFLIDPTRLPDRWSCLETLRPQLSATFEDPRLIATPNLTPPTPGLDILIEVVRRSDGAVLASATTKPGEQVVIDVPMSGVPIDLFVRMSAEGYLSVEVHRARPFIGFWVVSASLAKPAELERIYGFIDFDASMSAMSVYGRDCHGAVVEGASFWLTPEAGDVAHMLRNASSDKCVYSASSPLTDDCSQAMLYNLEPGTYVPNYAVGNGPVMSGPPITLRANTFAFVYPQP